jgi:KH/beta-lactamase-domain protein
MSNVLELVKSEMPSNACIEEIVYEGPDIILYTSSKEFFRGSGAIIRSLVDKVKKRIEVRSCESILMSQSKAEELIRKEVPKEAGLRDVYFEPEFAKVVIHAEKPGIVIGKAGETLRKMKETSFWTPYVARTPAIDSEIIAGIRKMLHKEAGYRKKFLHSLGEKIYTSEKKAVEWARLLGLGGCREVGRSCFLLMTPQSRIMLDCGVSFSATRPFPYLDVPEVDLRKLDGIVLSHPHMDHVGLAPYLFEYGYRGPVWCTRPTRDQASLMCLDYIKVSQREGSKAPYTSKGIEEMIKHTVTLEWGQVTDITPDIRLTMENSGHILGGSLCHMNIGDGFSNFVYSGDIKYERTKLFDAAYTGFPRVASVLLESTYGDEILPPHKDGEAELVAAAKRTVERGGKLIIPAFAMERAQDVVLILVESGITAPIYLDGMIWDVTAIHTAYPEFLSKNMQMRILRRQQNPFTDPRIRGIGSTQERSTLLHSSEPAIVLTTSGMLQGGPVMEYLREWAPDPKNTLLFVGYQAEGTPGRRIQKGWRYIPMEGRDNGLQLNLEVSTVRGLSAHSDYRQMIDWLRSLHDKTSKIICNHGEASAITAFMRTLHRELKVETVAPRLLETVRLR